MSEIKGLFEAIGGLTLGIAGLYIGYKLGAEAVEYTKTIAENPDVLGYVVNQHPAMTKLVTTLGIGVVMSEVGRVSGGLVDLVLGSRKDD